MSVLIIDMELQGRHLGMLPKSLGNGLWASGHDLRASRRLCGKVRGFPKLGVPLGEFGFSNIEFPIGIPYFANQFRRVYVLVPCMEEERHNL